MQGVQWGSRSQSHPCQAREQASGLPEPVTRYASRGFCRVDLLGHGLEDINQAWLGLASWVVMLISSR